jgi:hypothetical protein
MMKAIRSDKNNARKGFQLTLEYKLCEVMNNCSMNSPQFEAVSTQIRMSMTKATHTKKNNVRKEFQQTLEYKLSEVTNNN